MLLHNFVRSNPLMMLSGIESKGRYTSSRWGSRPMGTSSAWAMGRHQLELDDCDRVALRSPVARLDVEGMLFVIDR